MRSPAVRKRGCAIRNMPGENMVRITLMLVLGIVGALAAGPLMAQPTVTIDKAGAQADPTNASPVVFTAVFSEAVVNFDGSDISFTGSTVGGTPAASASTADNITWTIDVTGMTGTGTVIASIGAAVCDAQVGGQPNQASTSTDNIVDFDNDAPTPTVSLAAGQNDRRRTTPPST